MLGVRLEDPAVARISQRQTFQSRCIVQCVAVGAEVLVAIELSSCRADKGEILWACSYTA